MDYAAHSPIAAGPSRTWFAAIADSVKTLCRRQTSYLRTSSELSELTDRELADLGMTRADIPAIARRAMDAA